MNDDNRYKALEIALEALKLIADNGHTEWQASNTAYVALDEIETLLQKEEK
jgi:hypothetical protein